MKYIKMIALIVGWLIGPSTLLAQSPASVTWNLTSDANVSSTTGNVTGTQQTVSNLAVANYNSRAQLEASRATSRLSF